MADTTQSVDVDPIDSIADLLSEESVGDTETPTEDNKAELESEDSEDITDDTELSTEEADDTDVEEDTEEEADEETLAAMLGVKEDQILVDDDGGFSLTVAVDGKKSNIPIKDLIDGYQFSKTNTHKAQTLANEKKQFEQNAQEQYNQVNALLERNQGMANALEQELLSEYQGIDWEDLRQYDPAEFSAKKHDYAMKYQKINRMQSELQEQAQQTNQKAQAEGQHQYQAYLKDQFEVMLNDNPAWRNDDTFKKDMGDLRSFSMDSYGFSEEDLSNVSDSRLIKVLQDAKAYRQGKSFTEKRQKVVPKYQKSKGKVTKKGTKLSKLTKLARSAQGSNKRSAQTSAITELLLGG